MSTKPEVLPPVLPRYVVLGRVVDEVGTVAYEVTDTPDDSFVGICAAELKSHNEYLGYMDLLEDTFFPAAVSRGHRNRLSECF